MARSSVSRTRSSPPTLPPSASTASGMTLAENGNADIVEGGGDRGMRLVDGDADRGDLVEGRQDRIGNGAGCGLDQTVALGAKRLGGDVHDLVVADRVGELVGARGLLEIDIEDEIEPEALADLGLMLHHAVIGVQRQPVNEHPVSYTH